MESLARYSHVFEIYASVIFFFFKLFSEPLHTCCQLVPEVKSLSYESSCTENCVMLFWSYHGVS